LWQEGHTAHATEQEAIAEAEQMLQVYGDFAEDMMAMPVLRGTKSPNERFAGALETYCIEALMQDGKALQAGTSHFLGQNFAKAFDVTFQDKDGKVKHVWATSWGVSTRLVGALVMSHSDDQGLVIPPKLAPTQIVIIPIYRGPEQLEAITLVVEPLLAELQAAGIRVKFDDRDTYKPGWKFNEYELKGVPIRIAIGPRDLESKQVEIARRDTLTKETMPMEGLIDRMVNMLSVIQKDLFDAAKRRLDDSIVKVDSWSAFEVAVKAGGFIAAHWDGTAETEELIKGKTKATIRCIPLNNPQEDGSCILTGKPSSERVLFAIAY